MEKKIKTIYNRALLCHTSAKCETKKILKNKNCFTQKKKNYEDDDASSASFMGDFFLSYTYTA